MTIKRINAGRGHRYTIDGQRAVGVTTALKALPKDLTRWAARTVAEYVTGQPHVVMEMLSSAGVVPTAQFLSELPTQKRNDAAVRGTQVHLLAEQVARGDEVDVPEHLEGHVESYIRFCDDWDPSPVLSEVVVASRSHLYAGTLDSIQDIPELGRVLVDYKTSRGIYGETALQVAAYRFADVYLDGVDEVPMIPVDDTYVLHITADDYELVPLDAGKDTFETFLAVLEVYKRAIQQRNKVRKLDLLLGEPLSPPRLSEAA